ncbi:MAG TPA: hypothetical protein VKU61_02815 [Candidatus Binatia bacterium]|nr:hypothetical protein [Candidatus Binatia bacterium]
MDGSEALDLAGRAAQALARPVAETREAELMVPAPTEKRRGKGPKGQTAAALLRGQAAKVSIEQEGGFVRVEATSVRDGRLEHFGGNDRHGERRIDETAIRVKWHAF